MNLFKLKTKFTSLIVIAMAVLSILSIVGISIIANAVVRNITYGYTETPAFQNAAIIVIVFTVFVLFLLGIAVTVTRRFSKDVESLKSTENTLRIILDNMPLVTTFIDKNFTILECNETAPITFGLRDKQEFINRFFELFPESQPSEEHSKAAWLKMVSDAFETGYKRFEWLYQKPDGELIPCEVTLIRVVEGNKDYLLSSTMDLRDFYKRKEAEKTIQNRLQAMLDSSPLICSIVNKNFEIVDISHEIERLLKIPDKQIFIDRLFDFCPEYQPDGTNTFEKVAKAFNDTFETGYVKQELVYQNLDGELIPMEETLVRVKIEDEDFIFVYARDLRDFYKYKESEANTRLRVQAMLDSSPMACFILDKNFNVLELNQETINLFKVKTAQEFKDNFFTMVPEYQPDGSESAQKMRDLMASVLSKGSIYFDWVACTINKEDLPCGVYATAISINNEDMVIVHLSDLSEHYEHLKIQEASEAKSSFIANISHELRTPMNSILGYSELALDDMIPPTTREYLKKIVTNARWLLDIINDVLDISKIESGNLELENIPFELDEILSHCQSLLMPSALKKGLILDFSAPHLEGTHLIGDPTKLSQIFINILSNAIKFTDKGFVKCSVDAIEISKENCRLKFEIKDTGIGMNDQQLSRIFDPFMQADSSTTRKYGGTGLGLPIAQRLIEAMGGNLTVESFPGLGSKFSFTLIFYVSEYGTNPNSPGESDSMQKPNFDNNEVLIVDDNDMNQDVAYEYLKRVGIKSTVAGNGKEAVEIVKQRIDSGQKPFDLIFMDIHMPEMDGKEAASIIRNLNTGTPIVAMTAETMTVTGIAPYKDYGMESYLSKPFTKQELWKCLLKHLKPVKADTLK